MISCIRNTNVHTLELRLCSTVAWKGQHIAVLVQRYVDPSTFPHFNVNLNMEQCPWSGVSDFSSNIQGRTGETESNHDVNIVFTDSSNGCHNDKCQRYHKYRQSCQDGDSWFAVFSLYDRSDPSTLRVLLCIYILNISAKRTPLLPTLEQGLINTFITRNLSNEFIDISIFKVLVQAFCRHQGAVSI